LTPKDWEYLLNRNQILPKKLLVHNQENPRISVGQKLVFYHKLNLHFTWTRTAKTGYFN